MKLVILDGPQRGSSFALDKPAVTLGRKRDSDLSLPWDSLLSRFHCQLTERHGGWWVEDLGSGNGTTVDGSRIAKQTPLRPRGLLQVGKTRLVLVADQEPDESVVREFSTGEAGEEGAASTDRFDRTARHDRAQLESTVRVVAKDGGSRIGASGSLEALQTVHVPAGGDEEAVRRLGRRLEAVQTVSGAIAGKLDSTALLEASLDAIMSVVEAERGFILDVTGGEEDLKTIVVRQGDGPGGEVTLSHTIVRKAVTDRVAVLIHDAMSTEGLASAESIIMSAVRSAIAVPLVDNNEVVALILLDTTSVRAFDEADLELVGAIANQVALALANARLYQELRKAYEELRAAQDGLVQTEKLSIIGTLAASIAHDIGNVLTPISAISKLVMRDRPLDPKLKETFGRQMQRLKALTQQLLSFSRPRPPELVPTDINAQVEDSLQLVATDVRHQHVELAPQLAPNLPSVLADGDRLDQVFINLAINAAHAMEEGGGTLTIRTRLDGDGVAIDIADTGIGIPPERLETIFQPFYTTKGKAGTGMGLFSSKRIIEEEHGGTLAVESAVGKGTTFTIHLQLAEPQPFS